MPRISSGKRYAQAAFQLALEKKEFESWQEGLKKIADLAADEELTASLQSPRLPFDAKKELLQRALGKINPLVFNLALLLVDQAALRLSSHIFQQYNDLLDTYRGVQRAHVITAVPLTDEDRKIISNRLGKLMERKVIIDDRVDSSIIGGFIARMGDMLIDGSVRQRLDALKRSMMGVGR
ncbi:MAG: ATP synthase F1 subunit delta [Syntrophaceae bacterium]|nr:ATP synthase F1 subunit delta [Syntrophaceae bacterium]